MIPYTVHKALQCLYSLDIVSQVLDPKKERRPPMDVVEDCENYVKDCMIDCWKEDPERRPDFRTIRQTLRPMHTGL